MKNGKNPMFRRALGAAVVAGAVLAMSATAPMADEGDQGTKAKKPYTVYGPLLVDRNTYHGYIRYGNSCFVCHGPDGMGSSYAPALVDSLKSMSYEDFVTTVINGRKNVSSSTSNVMPSFGDDPNVMNYLDAIYAYLKARSDGALGRGWPHYKGQKILPR